MDQCLYIFSNLLLYLFYRGILPTCFLRSRHLYKVFYFCSFDEFMCYKRSSCYRHCNVSTVSEVGFKYNWTNVVFCKISRTDLCLVGLSTPLLSLVSDNPRSHCSGLEESMLFCTPGLWPLILSPAHDFMSSVRDVIGQSLPRWPFTDPWMSYFSNWSPSW